MFVQSSRYGVNSALDLFGDNAVSSDFNSWNSDNYYGDQILDDMSYSGYVMVKPNHMFNMGLYLAELGIDRGQWNFSTDRSIQGSIWRGDSIFLPNDGVRYETRGRLYSDMIEGNESANKLFGDWGNDKLYGDGGNDLIYGGKGNDHLSGGPGDDFLYGAGMYGGGERSGYSDRMIGGKGRDVMVGAEGNKDVFVFFDKSHFAGDVIHNFTDGEDKIDLRGAYSKKTVSFEVHDTGIDAVHVPASVYEIRFQNDYQRSVGEYCSVYINGWGLGEHNIGFDDFLFY